MAWIAAAIGWLKRVISAPATWVAVWIFGVVAGFLTHSDRLALTCFLIAAPALLLSLIADMRRYQAPPEPPDEPMDLASRVHRKKQRKQRRLLESFSRDDTTGHTLH
jgi:hypothetical protein